MTSRFMNKYMTDKILYNKKEEEKMAGNFTNANGKKVDLKLSIMHLNWNIPENEAFIPWLKEVKAAGYDGITSFAHWGLQDFITKPAALQTMLDDHGLKLAAVDAKLFEDIEQYKPILEFMQAMDSHLLVCIDPAGTPKDYKKYGAILNNIGELAQKYGIQAHYHNHTNSLGETLTDMESLVAELDLNKVSLMLDTGHASKDFIELPPKDRAFHFLEKYWDQMHYMEWKDWNDKSDLNTPMGEGCTDFDRLFDLMQTKGYSGWVTVEQNGNDGWSLDRSPYDTAVISREYIRRKLGV